MKLSIVIPAHNEERRIAKTLTEYASYFGELKRKNILDFEIVVVLNACKDNTKKIVNGLNIKDIRVIEFERAGKGFAVIEGFKDALSRTNDLVGFVDADLATGPRAFYDLVNQMREYDGAIASRYIKKSIVNPRPTLQRVISSRFYNLLIRSLFFLPYRDTQCGAKIFKRRALKETISSLKMTYWAFDTELLYELRKKGFSVREVATVWSDKEYSTINFIKAGPKMAFAIIRLRLLHSPFKRFIKLYDRLIKMLSVF